MKFEHVTRLDKEGNPLTIDIAQKLSNGKKNRLYQFFDTSPGWRKVRSSKK